VADTMTARGVELPKAAVFLTSVKDSELDDTCGMKFWYYKKEAGTGIIRRDEIVPRLLDLKVHDDLRIAAAMEDLSPTAIQASIDAALQQLSGEDRQNLRKMELLYRRLGWFAAWCLYMEPRVRAEYETLPIDPALVLDRDPLYVVAYPDRLLKHKATGNIIYREFAPAPPMVGVRSWAQQWHYNIRLHVGMAAAAEAQINVSYAEVMGLNQGFVSTHTRELVHPYVWGWKLKGHETWSVNLLGEDDKAKWERVPAWTFPGGVVQWVEMCGKATGEVQFNLSPPVYFKKEAVDDWVARRSHREREIRDHYSGSRLNPNLRRVYFPKIETQCYNHEGNNPCPFLPLCWNTKSGAYAFQRSGEFVDNNPVRLGDIGG
jgi:hypothetical protein